MHQSISHMHVTKVIPRLTVGTSPSPKETELQLIAAEVTLNSDTMSL
jgi:hypothetical protein